jgi:hypothetical protein
MWILIIFFAGCADGGRAIQTIEFNNKSACLEAGNQVLALDMKSCYSQPAAHATCVYKGN